MRYHAERGNDQQAEVWADILGLITVLRVDTVPLGDVRGYEGSECGGSFDNDVADPPHSSECRPDQARSHRLNTP